MLTLRAFAKLNLVLEVLGSRSDGYHDISSIIQTVSLHDVVTLEPADRIELKFSLPGVEKQANVALIAAQVLSEFMGCDRGVVIGLEKRIPVAAGLGGGSSDAAAVLRGLNSLWQLELTGEKLAAIGAGIGSDVPFFIYGGACLVEGRGERITPLSDLERAWFVLLRPDVPVLTGKTAALYGLLKSDHYSSSAVCANVRRQFESGAEMKPGSLYNVFEKVAPAAFPGMSKYIEEFRRAGASEVHLAGSGPVLFAMLYNEKEASDIHANLLAAGIESYLVTSTGRDQFGC